MGGFFVRSRLKKSLNKRAPALLFFSVIIRNKHPTANSRQFLAKNIKVNEPCGVWTVQKSVCQLCICIPVSRIISRIGTRGKLSLQLFKNILYVLYFWHFVTYMIFVIFAVRARMLNSFLYHFAKTA